jgi:hydrogenase maturation protease
MLSLQPSADAAPVLVLAIGNPSRGDDALGPLAAQRLAGLALPGVEVLTDFQLQVEHALDLLGRSQVIFIDAAASGEAPFELRPLLAAAEARHTSHSLSPAAVLDAYRRLTGAEQPPAQLLAIRGHEFELGAPPSRAASANLRAALAALAPRLRETLSRVREPPLPA